MRPLVSSIVALAIAIAPFTAMASPEKSPHKPATTKVMRHEPGKKAEPDHRHKKFAKASAAKIEKAEKAAKIEKAEKAAKIEKAEKAEKGEKAEKADAPISHVRHTTKPAMKDGLKPVLHHAHGVEVGGAGHKEPKVEKGVAVIPASLASKPAHGKLTHVLHSTKVDAKPADLPKLPNPNATKASKAGAEKGARKPSEKKNDDGGDKDGKPGRDEETTDLVAPKTDAPKVDARKVDAPRVDAPRDGKAKIADAKAKLAAAKAACTKDPIEIIRGPEIDTFALTKCDGTIAPLAIEHLSVLVRPGSAARPTAPITELAKTKGNELARGVHRVDERLAMRIQSLAEHFTKAGSVVKLSVVSGYRPTSIGSMHATGRAIDFRIEGAKNEDVVAFCKTLTDTGCGYYPNSSFVHLDVRDPGAGHVSWIDASGPGETPRYVSTWPPRISHVSADKLEPASAKEPAAKLDREEASEPVDEHPAELPQ